MTSTRIKKGITIMRDRQLNKVTFYKNGKQIYPSIKGNIAEYKGVYFTF